MDINKYIASGILEQYVLGDLSEQQRKEVEANARKYPEIRSEIDAIELALEQLALSQQTAPAPDSYDKIRQRILSGSDNPGTGGTSRSIAPWLAMLAILAALFFLWKWQSANGQLEQLQAENDQLIADQADCDSLQIVNEELQRKLNILRNADNTPYLMFGSDLAPNAVAAVYVNPQSEKAYLDVVTLPAPPTNQQYQLWALVDGTPVDMGVFEIDPDSSFLEVPYIANAGGYAVSLEPRGGSTVPSLDKIYVISG